jgi:hypothetical protein
MRRRNIWFKRVKSRQKWQEFAEARDDGIRGGTLMAEPIGDPIGPRNTRITRKNRSSLTANERR